jgi:hypothetical protein
LSNSQDEERFEKEDEMDHIIYVIIMLVIGFIWGWTLRSMKRPGNVKKGIAYKSPERFARSPFKGKY